MSVDLGVMARDLAAAHAEILREGEPVTVTALLVKIGHCPSCSRPLIRGERVGLCPSCGSEVDLC